MLLLLHATASKDGYFCSLERNLHFQRAHGLESYFKYGVLEWKLINDEGRHFSHLTMMTLTSSKRPVKNDP